MPVIENWWVNALWSVIPTLLIGLVFWFIIRSIMRADRAERRAYAKVETEVREARLQARVDAAEAERDSSNFGAADGIKDETHQSAVYSREKENKP